MTPIPHKILSRFIKLPDEKIQKHARPGIGFLSDLCLPCPARSGTMLATNFPDPLRRIAMPRPCRVLLLVIVIASLLTLPTTARAGKTAPKQRPLAIEDLYLMDGPASPVLSP